MMNMDIVVMCLILFTFKFFHYQLMEFVKMLLLFVQTTLYQHMLMYQFLEKVQLMSWTITSEKEYNLDITERGKKTCLSLHHNRISIFGMFMVQEVITSNQKIKWINTCPLRLGKVLKDFAVDNIRKKLI